MPLSAISENLQVAIVAVEDRRFVQHKGVDWRGTTRALLSNAQGDAGQQGGSTITQQYVKNYLFLVQAQTDAERADAIASTPGRKLREAKLALTLEQHETKDDILAGYLNLVAFLPSTYGAEATAERLFGIHAADLDLPQAALMAGMVNNPNKYDPLDKDHVTDAKGPARHRARHPATRTARSPRASVTRPSPLRSTSRTARRSPAGACRHATPRSTATSASTSWTTWPTPG